VKIGSLLSPAAAVAFVAAAVLADATGVQASQEPPAAGASASRPATQAPAPPAHGAPAHGMRPMRGFPAPANLQVLPKNLTGKQLRDIMQTWAGSLGVKCGFCHQPDPNSIGPNGRPRLNYADDTKDDKKIARLMYTMTQHINADYISKTEEIDTDAMDMTVTCGTCHRGHEMPEDFAIPKKAPPGSGAPSGGPPAAAPPASN